jgi:hypothetical protein
LPPSSNGFLTIAKCFSINFFPFHFQVNRFKFFWFFLCFSMHGQVGQLHGKSYSSLQAMFSPKVVGKCRATKKNSIDLLKKMKKSANNC